MRAPRFVIAALAAGALALAGCGDGSPVVSVGSEEEFCGDWNAAEAAIDAQVAELGEEQRIVAILDVYEDIRWAEPISDDASRAIAALRDLVDLLEGRSFEELGPDELETGIEHFDRYDAAIERMERTYIDEAC